MPTWSKTFLARAGIALVACLLAAGETNAQTRPDLVIAVNSIGSKLDPADTPLATELKIFGSIFDTLIKRDYAAEARNSGGGAILVPSLATLWKRINPRTLELQLRQGVKFHNGDELTADDVAFTFSPERIFGNNAMLPSARQFLHCLDPVEVVSRYTVRIRSCADDPTLELKLAHYSAAIVDKRAYLSLGQAEFKRAPIGTGPLEFVEWKSGDYIKFKAFDAYFGGRPTFQNVVFREVPEAAARVAGLVSGEFDIITQVSPDQFSTIESNPDLQVLPSLLEQMQMLWVVATEPVVADRRIRQAMAVSIDREKIVSALWDGKTNSDNQFQLPTLGSVYDGARKGFQYDPARARALLADAGYKGSQVTLRVIGNYYVNGETVAQAVQSVWQAVGLNVKLEIVENFTQAYAPGAAAVMGGCGFEYAAPESLGSCFFGDQALTRQRGFPQGIPGMEALAQQLATMDQSQRKQVFQKMLDVFESEVPAIPLFRTPQFFAAKRSVHWQATPDFRMDLRPDNLSFAAAAR